jgi:hypothetical protein
VNLHLSAPLPLAAAHVLGEFACGEASLDEWLKRRALTNQISGSSRGFVVTVAEGRAVNVSQNAGVRALLVHALHDRAKQFYEHYGFQESPQHPMTLMLRLNFVKT